MLNRKVDYCDRLYCFVERWGYCKFYVDIIHSELIAYKCVNSIVYSQHLLAAMVTNYVQHLEPIAILKDEKTIISYSLAFDIVNTIRDDRLLVKLTYSPGQYTGFGALTEQYRELESIVAYGVITDEIQEDFNSLGWVILPNT